MKKWVSCAFLLSSLSVFSAELSPQHEISIDEAYQKQKKGALIIDVRTPEEYFYIGHAPGQINVPLFFEEYEMGSLDARKKTANVENKMGKAFKTTAKTKQRPNDDFLKEINILVDNDPNKDIILICKAGPRSKEAAKKLLENGYKNVTFIKNGFEGEEEKKTNRRNINGWKNSPTLPWASY